MSLQRHGRSLGHPTRLLQLAFVVLVATACTAKVDAQPSADGSADSNAIPLECRGFPMEGIQYSPGGTALPNKCKPFDRFTNNPYAVRCVDVLSYKTQYAGDEYCILPPPPDKGVQIGIHARGTTEFWKRTWTGDYTDYSDRALMKDFEVKPGDEVEQTYVTNIHNADPQNWYRIDWRMRTGSHHMASYKASTPETEGFRPPDGLPVPEGADGGFLWNAQRADSDRPISTLEIPEEDAGLGSRVDTEQTVLFDVHHINTGSAPILREAWMNIWWTEGPVTRLVRDQPMVAPVTVPPNATTVLESSYAVDRQTRVLSLFGHRHAWTRRFNAWVHRVDGTDEPVYESFNWEEVPTYSYESVSKNPTPDVAKQIDGASSGLLLLEKGDQLFFDCHVDTTQARASEIGKAVPTETLVFGNKAFDAEMCILYGQMIDTGPAGDGGTPTDAGN